MLGAFGRTDEVKQIRQVDARKQGGREARSAPVEAERLLDDVLLLGRVSSAGWSPRTLRRLPAQTKVTGSVTVSSRLLRSAMRSSTGFATRPCTLSVHASPAA